MTLLELKSWVGGGGVGVVKKKENWNGKKTRQIPITPNNAKANGQHLTGILINVMSGHSIH